MNRLVTAILFTAAAIALAACGDTGDHFGDFAHTGGSSSLTTPAPNSSATAGPATVSKIVLSIVGPSPNPNTPGTYALDVSIYGANGQPVPSGTLLSSSVILTSNAACAVEFALPVANQGSSQFYTSVATNVAPGSGIVVGYAPGSISGTGCTPQTVTITANLQSNAVAPGTLSLFGGLATVTGVTLTALATPNPVAAGVYPFYVTLTGTVNGDAVGVLPSGDSLANPVAITSNNTCVVAFGTSPNIATGTSTQGNLVSSTSTVAYLYFNPGEATPSCPSSANVVVSASATDATTGTYSFTNGLPVP